MKRRKIHVGLRTVKTAVAIIIAMVLVEPYGATSSRLILAMLGAMAAVQPTFKESLESCVTQTAGVIFGAAAGPASSWSWSAQTRRWHPSPTPWGGSGTRPSA